MNHRKLQKRLTPVQCRNLHNAWHEAARHGYQLDALVSIRPDSNPSADSLAYAKHVERYWRWLGQWCRRHVGIFYAVLTRETCDRGGEPCSNFHALVHVGDQLAALRLAHHRRYPGYREVDVKRAHQGERLDQWGKWGSALGYITKERMPFAAWNVAAGRHDKHYREGLDVLGKRYRTSANLRAAPAAVAVVNNPLVTPAMRRENRKATAR